MEKKMKWYTEARLGMIIHWGLYSLLGHGEWAMSRERIENDTYEELFKKFNPQSYHPEKWAKMCKQAGMKYAVMTAKHHEGFCLFDSELTDYKVTNTAYGRDIIREYVDAFRREGIKVGLYYSIIDWHHPDYPTYGDMYAPMRGNEAFREKEKEKNFDNYLKYMHGQIEELCTNYGKIDLLWLDYGYADMRGEKWKATELVRMIKRLQPDIVMNNRLEVSGDGFGSIVTEHPTEFCGDFVTPEQIVPVEGIRDYKGDPVPWECCLTTNNFWGYNPQDYNFKSYDLLVRKMVECTAKGGNIIINVGPDPEGTIPEGTVSAFYMLGAWMNMNGESIYGCGYAGLPKPEHGWITRSGNVLYYHNFEDVLGPICLPGIRKDEVESVEMLMNGRKLRIADSWVVHNYDDIVFVTIGDNEEYSYKLPDRADTVIKVTLKK